MLVEKRNLIAVTVPLLIAALGGALRAQAPFLRGDANSDGVVSISDEVTIQRHLFAGGLLTGCSDAADTNDDGVVNIRDQIEIVKLLADPRVDGWSSALPAPYPISETDPTDDDDVGCARYEVVPAQVSDDDAVLFEPVFAAPGETVELPVLIRNSVPVDAVQLVFRYDPDLVSPRESSLSFEDLGSVFDRFVGQESFHPVFMVNAHPEEGLLTVVVASTIALPGFEIPAGEANHVATIRFAISTEAPEGCSISLIPVSGEDEGVGPHDMRSEMTFRGEARFLSILPRVATPSICLINPDFQDALFSRGDSNDDGRVDIADAVTTLRFLFNDGEPLVCHDAADANDDGVLDIADPVTTLSILFGSEGVEAVGRPGHECALDPTVDDLPPCTATACAAR